MLVELFISEDNGAFLGETTAITINSNIEALQNVPVQFLGETRESVVQQVIKCLKSKGLTGKLRVR